MVSVITCPCCRQEQLNQFSYDGGVKEWFDCPVCGFGCSGKILAAFLFFQNTFLPNFFASSIKKSIHSSGNIFLIIRG